MGGTLKKHILISDADQLVLYALAIAFKDDAHVAKTVATASAAIGELTARSYDLCLLDLNLRHPHSLRMMSILGNLYSQTRLVVTTTCCFDLPELDGRISDALECGAGHFVAKPFQLSELTGLVKHLLTAEEDLHGGFRFTAGTAGRRTRHCRREPREGDLQFHLAVISGGRNKRWLIGAKTTDISDTGIGLTTAYPLKASDVISFGKDMEERTGVVVWSSMLDEQNCRAGIK